ncbi:MAG: monooxygenase [Betaproteobacteria bacterium]
MIIVVVQIPIQRSREEAIAMQTQSAPTFRALADKGLLRKDYINGEAGGGGVYYWESREAAEAWYTPELRRKMKEKFGVEPVISFYETYVRVDNDKGEIIVHK